MVPMKATVGFNLHGISASANGSFNAPNADVANKLEAAGVAEREKAEKPTKAKSAGAQ